MAVYCAVVGERFGQTVFGMAGIVCMGLVHPIIASLLGAGDLGRVVEWALFVSAGGCALCAVHGVVGFALQVHHHLTARRR